MLRADGSFEPRTLPKRHFAPIDFQGRIEIASKDGGRPAPLEKAVIDFDRDGRFTPGQLPVCPPERIAAATPSQARQLCGGATVGSGHIRFSVALPSGIVRTGSPLTLFNGPRQEGSPTVVIHAQTTVPATQTLTIVVPIERRRGHFRYRATLAIPPIAAGLGAITHLDVTIGRRFTVDGQAPQLHRGPLLRRRPPDPRSLHLRRRHDHRRQRRKVLRRSLTGAGGRLHLKCPASYTCPPRAASSTG